MPRRPLAPGDIIQVLWEDAQFAFEEDDDIDPKEAICDCVGHLVRIDRGAIWVAMEIGPGGPRFGTRGKFRIPRSVIRKIRVLKRGSILRYNECIPKILE